LNNTIHGNHQDGIHFFHSNNTRVEQNEIYDNGSGCQPRPNLNQIKLSGHIGSGVHYDPSEDSTVVNNTIYGNYIAGITIEDGNNITIQGNDINDNGNICTSFNSLNLDLVDLEDPDGYGVNLFNANNIEITNNLLSGNANYAVVSRSDTTDIEVVENNFIDNNDQYGSGRQQALDNGTLNFFDSNHWSDLGIAQEYDIDGDQNNQDENPANAQNVVTFSQTEFIAKTHQPTEEEADDDDSPLSSWSVLIALTLSLIYVRFQYRRRR
jgi:parallel beta-helix repeat protein